MSSTFKFHSQVGEVAPWQANYTFPNQSTNVQKQTVKLQPKTGYTYLPGQTCRIEFPSDNYLNVLNSVFLLDVAATGSNSKHLQRGGAHNLIKRLRINYGSLVIEDIQDYKTLVRFFYEVGVQRDYSTTTGGILDGMYDTTDLAPGGSSAASAYTNGVLATVGALVKPSASAGIDISAVKRTYALNLMSGVLTAKKLIPLKWMASQLSIEITWASYAESFMASTNAALGANELIIDNVQYLAEMVQFSDTYDQAFTVGLRTGVPIKFSSWHYHSFNVTGNQAMLQIHERSRSVKAAFAV